MKFKFSILTIVVLFPLVLVFLSNFIIEQNTKTETYSDVFKIPHNRVGLVLGASKFLKSGKPNLYFQYRVDAAYDLFTHEKIDYILVSGDNSRLSYDEPTDFKIALVKMGIPENRIFLDYAGFRTLDSVVRAKEVFGLKRITIISQKFHNERAIYLAEKNGIEAVGYNATDIVGCSGLKTNIREYFARVKVFVDLLLNVEPKFLGESIDIPTIVLDFPNYSSKISYNGCEELLSQTPKSADLEIFSDTIIDLSTIDSRLAIELKFNWFYEKLPADDATGRMLLWPNCIGISSIETLKDSKIIDEISLVDIIKVEAFERRYEDDYKRMKSVRLKDVNMDSYLDIAMTKECGKSCYDVIWIYNPKTETFTCSDIGFGYVRPIQYVCSNNEVLLFAYSGGDANSGSISAYYIIDDTLSFYQSEYFNGWGEDFNYLSYKNAYGDTIRIDTLSKK